MVVRGNPTAEELAAVVAVLASIRPAGAAPTTEASGWSAYWRSLRTPPPPGPSAWRMSARY